MDEFTDALMVALHAGADDPDRSAMGARMKMLVAELTNQKSTKLKKGAAEGLVQRGRFKPKLRGCRRYTCILGTHGDFDLYWLHIQQQR